MNNREATAINRDTIEELPPELQLLRECTGENYRIATRTDIGDYEKPLPRGEPSENLIRDANADTVYDVNVRKRL